MYIDSSELEMTRCVCCCLQLLPTTGAGAGAFRERGLSAKIAQEAGTVENRCTDGSIDGSIARCPVFNYCYQVSGSWELGQMPAN